jgi:hypothetical protein
MIRYVFCELCAGVGLFPTVFVAFVGAVIVIVAQRKVWAHA